jgi:outer membrane receptor protein involved in Fe transport
MCIRDSVKAAIRLNQEQTLTLAWQHHRQNDVQLYHKLVTGEYNTYAFDPQVRDLLYVRHEFEQDRGWWKGIRTTLSLHRSDETRKKQKAGSDEFLEEQDRVNSYGFGMDLVLGNDRNWSSVNGFEWYFDRVHSRSLSTDPGSGAEEAMRGLYPDNSFISNLSVFSLHSLSMGRWRFNGGLRYNHFILGLSDELFGDLSLKPDALVGNLSAAYQIFRNTDLSFSLNSSFRAPNINDVSSFGIADFRYEVPNFDLAPEKALNKEVGIRTKQKHFTAALFLYHNGLKDLVVNVKSTYQGQDSIDGVKVYTRENAGRAAIRGMEGQLEFNPFRFLTVRSFLVYTYGQNITGDEPLRRIPPLNGLLGIHWEVFRDLEFIPEWQFAAMQDRLSSGDVDDPRIPEGGTPGWHVFNLRAGYRLAGFHLQTGLLNLFDKAYRTHGSGVEEMGRSVYISLRYSF